MDDNKAKYGRNNAILAVSSPVCNVRQIFITYCSSNFNMMPFTGNSKMLTKKAQCTLLFPL